MTKDEALKLALEALEYFSDTATLNMDKAFSEEAITAIKEALAQPTSGDYAHGYVEGFNDACMPKPPQRKPLTEKIIMDSTRELLIDVRWPSTFIDVWRLCEAAHGIKE